MATPVDLRTSRKYDAAVCFFGRALMETVGSHEVAANPRVQNNGDTPELK